MGSRRQSRRLAPVAAALLASVAVCPEARADRAHDTAAEAVEATIAGTDREAAALAAALREPLQRMGLELQVLSAANVARSPQAAGGLHVAIDARPADRVDIRVWLGAETDAHAAARSVPRGPREAVLVEQVAYVVRATME